MKNNLQANNLIFKIIVLLTCFMLVMLYNRSKACNTDFIAFKKLTVLFRQDVSKKELRVLIKSSLNEPLQLYFFSAEGKLIKQVAVTCRQETIIKDMKKGMYLYECFNHDFKLTSGRLVLQ